MAQAEWKRRYLKHLCISIVPLLFGGLGRGMHSVANIAGKKIYVKLILLRQFITYIRKFGQGILGPDQATYRTHTRPENHPCGTLYKRNMVDMPRAETLSCFACQGTPVCFPDTRHDI